MAGWQRAASNAWLQTSWSWSLCIGSIPLLVVWQFCRTRLFDATCVDGRLAESCIKCIAANLLELAPHPLFASLVRASSQTVRDREETDTVPLVDDLRYHLEQLHGDGELSSGLPIPYPIPFHFTRLHIQGFPSFLGRIPKVSFPSPSIFSFFPTLP